MTDEVKHILPPVGKRPKCLNCSKELRPNFRRELIPFGVRTGKTIKVRTSASYGQSVPTYEDAPESRSLTPEERKQWRMDHPPYFLGTYGSFGDSRFCGQVCGYRYAVKMTGGRS